MAALPGPTAPTSIVEASIADLQASLSCGALTSVELVAKYLHRISKYDCQGPALNAIPILNTSVFDDAAASDDRRQADPAAQRPLEGIPYTIKDSYRAKGMTVASGSPAFRGLKATEDAFTVGAIREAGGVLLGRTNMPPMAAGGMQRGIYGRAENPYNPAYLAAAYASGSSNGSAVATAASFSAFGMGEETVSSGRAPASNNALVAYTPSRGCISIRGNWPLYPTCDVVVPHTRTMEDMLALLDVITQPDATTEGDFWRHQPFVKLPDELFPGKPATFQALARAAQPSLPLAGLRIAVPSLYTGGPPPAGATAEPAPYTNPTVLALWTRAKVELEALGASVLAVPDFPVVTAYENPAALLPAGCPRLPPNWLAATERGPLVARGWDAFLRANGDPALPGLSAVEDPLEIFPMRMRTAAELAFFPKANDIHWAKLPGYAREAGLYETEDLADALRTLETMRVRLCDEYLAANGCDVFVFPAVGDVGKAVADEDVDAAEHAWRNGVKYSNGNRALRHLGVPTVSVPMGVMADTSVPVNLTIAGRAYDDVRLLSIAHAYEAATKHRISPAYTPALPSDAIPMCTAESRAARPELTVSNCKLFPSTSPQPGKLSIQWTVKVSPEVQNQLLSTSTSPVVELTVNGNEVSPENIVLIKSCPVDASYLFELKDFTVPAIDRVAVKPTEELVVRDQTMVVLLARAVTGGRPSGWLGLL